MPPEELVTTGVRRKLSALRRKLWAHLVGRGMAAVVAAFVGAVFLTLGIDRALELDRAQRGLIVGLSLAGVSYVLWRFLIRPLRVRLDDEELALVLERHYGQLGDRLISVLQFAAADLSRTGASEAMVGQLARQANAMAEQLDPGAPVETRCTWRRAGLAAAAVAVLAVFTAFHVELMGLWFERNVLFANVPWPQQTYLTVEGAPEFKAVRGGSLAVTVTSDPDHVVPREVTFHMDFPGLGWVSRDVPAVAGRRNSYVKRFDNVADAFRFYVTGNDDRTEWCQVTVVDPPVLAEARFTVDYPAYMNRPSSDIPSEHGVLSVPPGGTIHVVGTSSKDLASARLLLDGEPAGSLRVLPVPRAEDAPLGVEGALRVGERAERASMTLRFELTDVDGVTNSRAAAFVLRVEPDQPPAVALERTGVRGDVTARAMLPLLIRARDDCGVAAASILTEPLAAAATTEPSGTTRPAGKQSIDVPGVPVGQAEVQVRHGLELSPMGLAEGQLVRVWAEVRDTLPASFGGPNRSESPALTFKIVSAEELLAELVRKEKEIRQDFTRVVTLQAEVRDRVRAVRGALVESGKIDEEVRRNLGLARTDQGRVADQCGMVAESLQEILDEMVHNRVGDAADRMRLSGKIIAPLRAVCGKPMLDVTDALDRASKQTDAAALREFSGESAEILDGFHRRLQEILKEMKQLADRQDLARALRRLIEDAQSLREAIEQRLQQEGGRLFEPASRPGR